MKIAIIGASGNIGSRIMKEALSRGHEVTAIIRNVARLTEKNKNMHVISCDILKTTELSQHLKNQDVVISAYGPTFENPNQLVDATTSLIEAAKKAQLKHLIAVGGAGSLEIAPDSLLLDSPHFPESWKPIARAHKQALHLYEREKELNWSYVHPAAMIEAGNRTGKFRIGGSKLLADEHGNSKISMEDYAIALVDEAENPKHLHKRFVVAY
jgi:putative NADH-flavin reductase